MGRGYFGRDSILNSQLIERAVDFSSIDARLLLGTNEEKSRSARSIASKNDSAGLHDRAIAAFCIALPNDL